MIQRARITCFFAALAFLFGTSATSVAQDNVGGYPTKFAQAGMAFLKIDVGARKAGMGGTNASVEGSIYDMFSNPAGLAFVQGFQASTTVTNWFVDTQHYGGGLAYRFGDIGTFGVSLVVMDYGDFRRTIPAPGVDGFEDLGTFNVSEYALGFAYARQITDRFYVGGHLRYATQNLGDILIFDPVRGEELNTENQVNNVVFDVGTMYYTGFRDLRFGMSIRNFSNQSDYFDQRFELPLTFDFGIAMDLLSLAPSSPGMDRNSELTLALDWQHPRDFGERLHAGLEYGFADTFFLRSGYKFNYDSESFTAGLGVKAGLSGYGLDVGYAFGYSDTNMGQIHRITLGIYGGR